MLVREAESSHGQSYQTKRENLRREIQDDKIEINRLSLVTIQEHLSSDVSTPIREASTNPPLKSSRYHYELFKCLPSTIPRPIPAATRQPGGI